MLALSEKGDNSAVDMLVGDIYGQDYKFGLKSTMIASSFGKVFSKNSGKKRTFSAEDISKSLLYAVSNNIGQIACVLFSVDIRGRAASTTLRSALHCTALVLPCMHASIYPPVPFNHKEPILDIRADMSHFAGT